MQEFNMGTGHSFHFHPSERHSLPFFHNRPSRKFMADKKLDTAGVSAGTVVP
jgi:hypothetical protein